MNSVGIDISKGRSTVAVMRPFGEVVISPFEVRHTDSELSELARQLKSLDGETRVVMEATGNYHAPVAKLLHDAGLYVSVVNAKLVHGYGNNDLRRVKTDKKDAVKLANYGLDRWLTLPRYVPEEDTRLLLKNCYRQYRQYSKVQTVLKNNLISLLDTVFPNANRLFSSPIRGDGSEKWVDFVAEFWHCRCVSEKSKKVFTGKYQRWCRKHGYNFSEEKAKAIHAEASGYIGVMPKSETTKLLVEQAVAQLRATSAALTALKHEMLALAAQLAAAVDQMVADDRDGIGLERCAAMVACRRMAQRDAALLKEIVIFHTAVAFGNKICNRPVDKFKAVFYEKLLLSGQYDAASIHYISPSFVRSEILCRAI